MVWVKDLKLCRTNFHQHESPIISDWDYPPIGKFPIVSCCMEDCESSLFSKTKGIKVHITLLTKSRRTYVVLQKRVGAVLEKELGDLQVAVGTRQEESGVSILRIT
mgnify:CR=1 FL=1